MLTTVKQRHHSTTKFASTDKFQTIIAYYNYLWTAKHIYKECANLGPQNPWVDWLWARACSRLAHPASVWTQTDMVPVHHCEVSGFELDAAWTLHCWNGTEGNVKSKNALKENNGEKRQTKFITIL